MLNVRPDPVDFRDLIYQPGLVQLPTRMAPPVLTEIGIEVRDQGSEGSCTGQALANVIDLQNIQRWRDKAEVPARVSARMLYESARVFDEYPDDLLPGSSARGAIKGFFHRGVCGVDLAPYFPGDLGWRLDVVRAKAARQVALGAYFRLRHVLNDCHAALAEAQAILCTAMVHDGWSRDAVTARKGVIRSPGGDPARAELTGAHAFAIVGYDTEGFLVLNSWGPRWGGFAPRGSDGAPGGSQPGVALWPYDEWCEHVLDAWVLRLQVPTALPSGFAGGYHLVRQPTPVQDDPLRRPVTPASVPARDVAGHVINIADGTFVAAPPYENDRRTFEETARFLRDNGAQGEGARYDHLLFFAHGGLNDLEGAAARAAAMTPIFKRHGVYPVFFLWHTGLAEAAGDVLQRVFDKALGRAGGFTDFTDTLLEQAARPIVGPIWREMKRDALRSFQGVAPGSAGWVATKLLADAALGRPDKPMRIHLVGHSAGAILLGEMLARARAEGHALANSLSTVSLFAAACTLDFFDANLAPVAVRAEASSDRFLLYNLTDDAERDDNVGGAYRKSLLYLVSNAFEDRRETPLAGMELYEPELPGLQVLHSGKSARNQDRIGGTTTHGGFDNDPVLMNHVLARVLERPTITEQEGGFSRADLVGRGF
ncbi:C1 family peptidase [Muricoccus aerilatus]|uniref:C1 family peptidase n=1 Tax=Muricoccus aerilatus TaxID=452982 RepID=UPI0005C1CC90|nr:C1 family peptidase [Roseomonas aerilata]